jgi:hypothetical protein
MPLGLIAGTFRKDLPDAKVGVAEANACPTKSIAVQGVDFMQECENVMPCRKVTSEATAIAPITNASIYRTHLSKSHNLAMILSMKSSKTLV